jgi:F-type H+-transporting ATPase subunit gamma
MTFNYQELSKLIIKLFDDALFDQVFIVYNRHESLTDHTSVVKKILPIEQTEQTLNETHVFEQSIGSLAKSMLSMYVQSQILLSLANAKLSEHSSRMIAMKNATDNAKEIASKLEIQYHRARQQAITEELIDVINGSNV